MVKCPETVTISELDHVETIESGQKNLSTANETSQIETNLPLVLTNKISNGERINVQDSRDVSCLSCASEMGELMTNTTIKHRAAPEGKTQNNETPKSDNKDAKLQTNTEDKIYSLSTGDKKRKTSADTTKHRQKFLKPDDNNKSEEFFLEFVVILGAKHDDVMLGSLSEMFLQMEWMNGLDRNCMYQLFQYFQNRFSS